MRYHQSCQFAWSLKNQVFVPLNPERDDAFRAVFEDRIARYDFRFVARVPLDFAEELLPADAAVQETVGLEQVDEVRSTLRVLGVFHPGGSPAAKQPASG